MLPRDLPVAVGAAGLFLGLCFGFPVVADTTVPAEVAVASTGSSAPASGSVNAVAQKVERLGARLGIQVPPGAPESARVRYLSHRLERLLDRGGPGLANDGVPVHLIRYLNLGVGRLDRTIWGAQGGSLGEPDREVLETLSVVLDAIQGKLDRLEEQAASEGGHPRLRAAVAPANDACASAVAIGNESVLVTTVDATNDAPASCGASASSPDVWYRYVAPTTGLVRFATSASDYDPVLTLFDACPGSGGTELACNDDSNGATEATLIESVTAGQEILVRVSGFSGAVGDLTLTTELTGGISGTVTKQISGEPLAGIDVAIWTSSPSPFAIEYTRTDASGTYNVVGLDGGVYLAEAGSLTPSYAPEVYQEISCPVGCTVWDGTSISVTAGAVTGGIDFTLEPLGAISGKVTASDPLSRDPRGEIVVWRSDGQSAGGDFMETDGTYRVGGLVPGTYYVSTNSYTHLDELYEGIYCYRSLCDPTTGAPVVVDPGATTSGIDFELEDYSTITGTITRTSDGTPVSCGVKAVSTDGTVTEHGRFDSPGVYAIQLLPPADYNVVTNCYDYFNEIWNDVQCPPGCDLSAGAPVTVPASSTVAGIDFALDELGAIEGAVYIKGSDLPIPYNIDVVVMAPDGTWINSDTTGLFGQYRLNRLYPGQYLLKAHWDDSAPPPVFQAELFDNVPCAGDCDLGDGALVPVMVNTTTSGVDFYLSRCSFSSYETVQGKVADDLLAQACEVLTIGPDVTILQNGVARLRAGKRVVLGNGFKVESGASLWILTDPSLSTEDQ